MSGLTIRQVQEIALPPGTVLLGGESGLERVVTGAATMRARTPAFPALHGGEVALISVALLRQLEPRPRFERLVAQLAEARVAAVVFFSPAGTPGGAEALFGEELGLVIEVAGREALPVFVVPPPHTPEPVELALHRALVEQREGLVRRSQELQQAFADLALAGRGAAAIVERLAAITGLPAAWEDIAGELRAAALPPGGWGAAPGLAALAPDLPALVRSAALPLLRWRNTLPPTGPAATAARAAEAAVLPLRAEPSGPAAGWRRLVVPFAVGGQLTGFISVFGPAGADTREVRLALGAAALAASIEALRARTATEAQSGALASLVNDWISGRFDRPEALAARARQLGQELVPPYVVAVLEGSGPVSEERLRRVAATLASAGNGSETGASRAIGPPASGEAAPLLWTMVDETRVALVVPLERPVLSEAAVSAVGKVLQDTGPPLDDGASGAPGHPPRRSGGTAAATQTWEARCAGVGRPAVEIEEVPRAYREALQALAIARRLGGRHRVAYFGTLGIYRLLAAVDPPSELAGFCDEVLGPLLAYDRRSGGGLLRTLDAYLATGGSPQLAATRLHTHRNTILYRLERIEQVLGIDLRQPEQQFALYLALRALELLGEPRPEAPPGGHAGREEQPAPPARQRRAQGATIPPALSSLPTRGARNTLPTTALCREAS